MKDKVLELLRTTELSDTEIAEQLGTTRQKITAIKRQHFQQGLGDKVEAIFEVTGIKAAVKLFANGKDCGCDERKAKLNMVSGLKVVNCLDESEHVYLTDFFARWDGTQTPPLSDWAKLQRIRERVFSLRFWNHSPTCPTCVNSITKQMRELLNKYQDESI